MIGGGYKDFNFDTDRTIFLGDLSYFCTEDDLVQICALYGTITAVQVRRGTNGKSLLFGLVEYAHPESTRIAFGELNGRLFMGRNLK